jgi:hypothetical protein
MAATQVDRYTSYIMKIHAVAAPKDPLAGHRVQNNLIGCEVLKCG